MDPRIAAQIPRPRAPGPQPTFAPPLSAHLTSPSQQARSEAADLLISDDDEDDNDDDDEEEEAEDIDVEDVDEDADADVEADADETRVTQEEPAPDFDPAAYNLHSILPLSTLTTSSHKPHCGPLALLHPSTSHFWQSDGPQPHLLNIHFFKLVEIRVIRVFLDFDLDESYTPTKMQFWAGTGQHDLEMVGEEKWTEPRGWQRVDLSGVGGREGGHFRPVKGEEFGEEWADYEHDAEDDEDEDGEDAGKRQNILKGQGVLRCFLLQIRVLENHQNGKDTHIRGLQIFAKDKAAARKPVLRPQVVQTPKVGAKMSLPTQVRMRMREKRQDMVELFEPDWARDVVLR